jgi:hypothetical protein
VIFCLDKYRENEQKRAEAEKSLEMLWSVHAVGKSGAQDFGWQVTKSVSTACKSREAFSRKIPGSRQKPRSLLWAGQAASIPFPPNPVPRRGDQSIEGVSDRKGKQTPDSRQPTESRQIVQDVKKSVALPKQYLLIRSAPKDKNRIRMQRFRMALFNAPERLALQRRK